jgi:two-component system sensor histidine kinase QseC
MKLLNKITIWFIVIVLLLTPISMYLSFRNIKKEIDKAETERMLDINDQIARKIAAGETTDRFTSGHPIAISTFNGNMPSSKNHINESIVYNPDLKKNECILTVNSYYFIKNTNYKISSYNYITEPNDILAGMMHTLLWKIIITILALSLTARLLSRKLLSPFRQTISAIHYFNLKKKEKIVLPKTNIKEFKELNTFLQKMTDKAMEDYASVKEFSENASHELQTPVAIMRSKLELLTETSINELQASLIVDMQNAVEKLSHINKSLTLLTRLENHEYEASANISFCKITGNVISAFDEWIKLKQLTIIKELDKNIALKIHPSLAEMLVSNLISNAIRHNIEGGFIYIKLQSSTLQISNTGSPPTIPVDELFKRFKKSNQSANSIGLGLAIVKQICDVSQFSVNYYYADGWHSLVISFKNQPQLPVAIPFHLLQSA